MDGTICLPPPAEPLELRGYSDPAREHLSSTAQKHLSSHDAWLHQPPRTKIRRPLSPICRLIIGDPPPPPAFWQRPIVRRYAPLAGSIVVHSMLMILGLMTFRAERPRVRGGIPIAGAITTVQAQPNRDITPTFIPTAADLVVDAPQIDRVFPMPHEPRAAAASDSAIELASTVALPPTETDSNPVMLGVGPQTVPTLPSKRAAGAGSGTSTATDSPTPTSAGQAEAKFFGVPGTGQAVVFVCDASGSMLGTNDVIISQLQRALLAMHSKQVFNVIFFSGRSAPLAFDARQMVPADANNKLAACAFAKRYSCGGNSRGLPAIRSALQRNPDLMYLVTDGDFDDSPAIVSTIRSMNHDGFTKINVILISGAAQADASSYKVLKQIAEENGGTCRIVNPNSL